MKMLRKIIYPLCLVLINRGIELIFYPSDHSAISIFVSSLFVFVWTYIFFNYFRKKTIKKIKKILDEQEPDLRGEILSRHFLSLEKSVFFAQIGRGYLLYDKFVYILPPRSIFFKTRTIQYSDIEKIIKYKKMGENICKIYLKSNKVMSFIMEEDAFYYDIVKFAGNPVFKNTQMIIS